MLVPIYALVKIIEARWRDPRILILCFFFCSFFSFIDDSKGSTIVVIWVSVVVFFVIQDLFAKLFLLEFPYVIFLISILVANHLLRQLKPQLHASARSGVFLFYFLVWVDKVLRDSLFAIAKNSIERFVLGLNTLFGGLLCQSNRLLLLIFFNLCGWGHWYILLRPKLYFLRGYDNTLFRCLPSYILNYIVDINLLYFCTLSGNSTLTTFYTPFFW